MPMDYPFITLYGVNNIGKTTQAERLVKMLKKNGQPAEHMKYPQYEVEPSGPFIDKILRQGQKTSSQKEVEMWMAINRHQAQLILEKKLKKGFVVSEDYVGTGIAWGMAHGSSREWMEAINDHLRKEDVVILLDGERFTDSIEANHVHETDQELVARCRQAHLELAKLYGWSVINANQSVEDIQNQIWEIASNKCKLG
ncbi:MAG: hypothetical protein V1838_01540 [Patescibacteria group bacterium]